jgi:hypothetical protein
MDAVSIKKTSENFWQFNTLPAFSFWGVEMASDHSFYSCTHSGWGVATEAKEERKKEQGFFLRKEISLSGAEGVLLKEESLQEGEIVRTHSFEATKDSALLDFVSRYVFPKKMFESAHIDGKEIKHKDQNVYRQFSSGIGGTVVLKSNGYSVEIKIKEISCTSAFVPVLYVRDEPGNWVVHIRLLPKVFSKIVTKLNTRWYHRALPDWINKFLFSFCFGKHWLLYRGERKKQWGFMRKVRYRLLPLSAYPLATLQKGEVLSVCSSCRFEAN